MFNRNKIIKDIINESKNINEILEKINQIFTPDEMELSLQPIKLDLTKAFINSKTVGELINNLNEKFITSVKKLIPNPSSRTLKDLKKLPLKIYVREEWYSNCTGKSVLKESYLATKDYKFLLNGKNKSFIFREDIDLSYLLLFLDVVSKKDSKVELLTKRIVKTKNGKITTRFIKADSKHFKAVLKEPSSKICLSYKFPRGNRVTEFNIPYLKDIKQ